jgi:hypothetical protein
VTNAFSAAVWTNSSNLTIKQNKPNNLKMIADAGVQTKKERFEISGIIAERVDLIFEHRLNIRLK